MNNDANQDSSCKIFVGGLTWNTTREMLTNEFIKYGDIVDSIVIKNQETGNSRGFGFVTFKDNQSANRAAAFNNHVIDSKNVDVKLCDPPSIAKSRNAKQRADNCKVFVGGLPHGVTEDEIKQLFSRYGTVKDFKMKYDENKQRPRGFGFITFESEHSANQVLQEHFILFNGKQIEVKPQKHNVKQMPLHLQQHQQMGMQPNFANTMWNQQNWAQNSAQQTATAAATANSGWGTYNQLGASNGAGVSQSQWGYTAGTTNQGSLPGSSYGMNTNGASGSAGQSNWNYNYYGQHQGGYYQNDTTAGTGTFNF